MTYRTVLLPTVNSSHTKILLGVFISNPCSGFQLRVIYTELLLVDRTSLEFTISAE